MSRDEFYYDLGEGERERAVAFLLKSLLKSKTAGGGLSDAADRDEDVNIYLAHLMFAVSTPRYRQIADRYLSPYSGEVQQMIQEADDHYIKYFIYKVNADHLLIHLSIFCDLGEDAPRTHTLFHTGEEKYSNRATAYYGQAAHFNQRIYRKQTAVGAVLGKLADRFEEFRDVLKAMRRDYFHFVNTLSDKQFADFVKDADDFEHASRLKIKQDEFLDLYGAWLKTRDDELRGRIQELSRELKELDPGFRFEMP